MAIPIEQKPLLTNYLTSHGALTSHSPHELILWLGKIPSKDDFLHILSCFSAKEKGDFFLLRSVTEWYGNLYLKLHNNTHTSVSFLGTTEQERKRNSLYILDGFIVSLADMSLFEDGLVPLVFSLLVRDVTVLQNLFILLVVDGLLSETSVYRLQVEMSPYKRWQSIGLSQCPAVEDVVEYYL